MTEKESPGFSVCIPTFNRPELISKAINSVLSQTLRDYELLIYDNSRDNRTREVVERFEDERIRYKKHDENIGMIGNFNALLRDSRAKYVKFLNDDDIMKRNFLEIFSKYLKDNDNVVLAGCRAEYIDKYHKVQKVDPKLSKKSVYIVEKDYSAILMLEGLLPIRTPSHVIINRDIALKVGGFSAFLTLDLELWARMLPYGSVLSFEDECLISFLVHSGSESFGFPSNEYIDEKLKVYKTLLGQIKLSNKEYVSKLKTIESYLIIHQILHRGKSFRELRLLLGKWLSTGRLSSGVFEIFKRHLYRAKFSLRYDAFRKNIVK